MLTKTLKGENNLLEGLFNDSLFTDYLPKTSNIAFDVIETDGEYKIGLLLAGYNKEDFNLEVDDGKLIITGERTEEDETKYNFKNSFFGKITKTFTLPKDIIIDKIDAEYVNGVLNVTIPKDKELINNKKIVVR